MQRRICDYLGAPEDQICIGFELKLMILVTQKNTAITMS